MCDWDGVDEESSVDRLDEFRKKPVAVAPFQASFPFGRAGKISSGPHEALLKTYDVPQAARYKTHKSVFGAGRRIRLWLPILRFLRACDCDAFAEVLENSTGIVFQTLGYCFSPDDGSAMRKQLLRAFEHIRKIGAMTNRDAARAIHEDAIDMVVDLKGYTKDARTEILAYRPAPIHVNYLGYPGTMGADFIDYMFRLTSSLRR